MTERLFNLVVPLAEIATDKRITDTNWHKSQEWSGAVSQQIGFDLLPGDVDSTNNSTPPTVTTPGCRTSTTATRTTGTRTTTTGLVLSADYTGSHHADFSFTELVQAYLHCRQHKRNTASALAFEQDQERQLIKLNDDLKDGTYRPGKSICFIITRPKPREVWAADFRDRIVHHLLYNRISQRFYASFIKDSCACIPGRGTLYGAQRLEAKIRSIMQNWSRPAHYLKCDIANFFVSIDKEILFDQIKKRVNEPFWLWLASIILFHDPRENFELRGDPAKLALVPAHKRLANQSTQFGLPIGNLSSQFFANIYMDALDQHIKHRIRCKHYIRYVDDFILLHESPQWLNAAHAEIESFLSTTLNIQLNPRKTILQPIERGVDFVGQVIKPWSRTTRRRTFNDAISRIGSMKSADVYKSANSYFGLLRQSTSSHKDRAKLAKAVMLRGHAVNMKLTKAYHI